MFKAVIASFLLSLLVAVSARLSLEEVKNSFGTNFCIKGTISSITTHTDTFFVKESSSSSTIDNDLNNALLSNASVSEKSEMSKLHELAQYNEIQYSFKLIKEEGPPHNKIFTLSLTLGDEVFKSEGSSLKIAQRNAASLALEKTEYEAPPIKEKNENDDTTTPTVLLNNLLAKLGLTVEYFLASKDVMLNLKNSNKEISGKSYLQKLNESMSSDIYIRKDDTQMKGPFKVGVKVRNSVFYGTSHTVQAARHEAASKAIDHLLKIIQDGNLDCLQEGQEEECKQAKANIKSPISLVYEAAQLRNLPIEFEIIEESGPPHKRIFVTKCTLGHLSTTGSGKSKKDSKKVAAQNMLERILELPEVSQDMQVKSILKPKSKKKKKKKILKTNLDVISEHVDNIISSIKDHGLSLSNKKDEKGGSKKLKNKKPKHLYNSYQDGILELSNLMQFQIQFTDFMEDEQFYTLMSVQVNPEQICLGQGFSTKNAREVASKAGLILLQNLDLGEYLKKRKITELESEIKEKIQTLLKVQTLEEQKNDPLY